MAKQMVRELHGLVSKLKQERQAHENAIADIDAAFRGLGLEPDERPARRGRRRGRPKGAGRKKTKRRGGWPKGKKRKAGGPGRPKTKKRTAKRAVRRGKGRTGKRYSVPGPESIMKFARKAGAKGATGADIDKHWKSEGRAGSAYNLLGQLVSSKQLRRAKVKGERGSRYIATK